MNFASVLAQSTGRPTDAQAYNFIVRHLEKGVMPANGAGENFDADLRPEACDDIDQLIAEIRKHVRLTESAVDCFKIMLSIVISLKVPGPMMWYHCVGPSSSAKTTLANIIASAQDKCFTSSAFNGLYSGFRGEGGADTSLIPLILNKVLIILDFTPILKLPSDAFNKIAGDFRDIFDGKGSKHFGNGIIRSYENVLFGCLTCVTNVIRAIKQSDLGERFLMMEINGSWDEKGNYVAEKLDLESEGNAFDSILDTVISGMNDTDAQVSLDNLKKARQMCWGYITHLHDWLEDETHSVRAIAQQMKQDRKFKAEIEALSFWLEYARCPLPTRSEELLIRPAPALIHRTVKSVVKAIICVCIACKATSFTPEIRRLGRKIIFDTAMGYPLELMNWIATHPLTTREDMSAKVGLTVPAIATLCNHLVALGVIESVSMNAGTAGRPKLGYRLTPTWRKHADTIGLTYDAPDVVTAITSTRSLSDLLRGK